MSPITPFVCLWLATSCVLGLPGASGPATLSVLTSADALPVFASKEITLEECLLPGLVSLKRTSNCKDTILSFFFRSAVTDQNVTAQLRIASSWNRSRPVKIVVNGDTDTQPKRNLASALLAPVRNEVVDLKLWRFDGLTSQVLGALDLPNLLKLQLDQCANVQIKQGTFGSYPRLRSLVFHLTTISALEVSSFSELPTQCVLALNSGLSKSSLSETDPKVAELRQFHCSCDNKWLRNLFQSRPKLLRHPEFISYGNDQVALTIGVSFPTVDCKKPDGDMIVDENEYHDFVEPPRGQIRQNGPLTFTVNDPCH